MSLQFISAVVLTDGAALLEQFSETRIREPSILELARRVEVVVDPELDPLYPKRYPNRVAIVLRDGRRFEARVDFPKGSLERPLSFEDVAVNFGAWPLTPSRRNCSADCRYGERPGRKGKHPRAFRSSRFIKRGSETG